MFTVSILNNCKTCHNPIDKATNPRRRSYCSSKCRNLFLRKRYAALNAVLQRRRANRKAVEPHPTKKKCAICNRWYIKVASHVFNTHHLSAREYKEYIGAPLTKGILTDDKRLHLSKLATSWEMGKQLAKSGAKTRYTKNDPRTKETLNKGKKYIPNDYY